MANNQPLWEILSAPQGPGVLEQSATMSLGQHIAKRGGGGSSGGSDNADVQYLKYLDDKANTAATTNRLAQASTPDQIARVMINAGRPEEAASMLKTYADIEKISQENLMSAEGRAMNKAFGALIAAPEGAKQEMYSNVRGYLNREYGAMLPEELTDGVMLAIGNMGNENNKMYQSMMSNPDMLRHLGKGLIETFTTEGQQSVNNILKTMVSSAQKDIDDEMAIKEGNLQVDQDRLALDREKFQVDTAFRGSELSHTIGMDQAKLGLEQAKFGHQMEQDAKGPRSQAMIQLMEYRDQLVNDGANEDKLAMIDSAINAELQGSRQGKGTNVTVQNQDGSISLDGIISKDIAKQYEKIQDGKESRVNITGTRQAIENLRGTGLETGPGFDVRNTLNGLKAFGTGPDSQYSIAAENVRHVQSATAQFTKWGMEQQGRGFTDADLKWFQENTVATSNLPEVNAVILDAMERVYERQDQYVSMLADAGQKGLTPAQFQKEWNEYEKSLPDLIPRDVREYVSNSRKGAKQSTQQPSNRAANQQNRLKDLFQ